MFSRLREPIRFPLRTPTKTFFSVPKAEFEHKTYFKIMKDNGRHYDYQYKEGLNVQLSPLSKHQEYHYDYNLKFCERGLSFTDIKNIFYYLKLGTKLRHVTIPINDRKLELTLNADRLSWCSNMITLGTKLDLDSVGTFEYLRQAGCDFNSHDGAALKWAAERGNLSLVKYLCEQGAMVNDSRYNISSLKLAAEQGHLSVVTYLAEFNNGEYKFDGDEVAIAAANGHTTIVAYLCAMKYGLNIGNRWRNIEDFFQYAVDLALYKAATYGRLCVVTYLLEGMKAGEKTDHFDAYKRSPNINCQQDLGRTPLVIAAENGHYETVKYLHERGAECGNDALAAINAAAQGGHAAILKYLLLEQKINPEDYEQLNELALERACAAEHLSIVQILCETGHNFVGCDNDDEPLRTAIKHGRLAIVKYLFNLYSQYGRIIDINLIKQAKKNSPTYKFLLGADVNVDREPIPVIIAIPPPLRKLGEERYHYTMAQKKQMSHDTRRALECSSDTY